MSNKLITFIDQIGRTILAEELSRTDTRLLVKNPVILHVQPNQNGQLNIQTIPLYFREFVGPKSKENGTTWSYSINNIVVGEDVDNEQRLVAAYHNIWASVPTQNTPPKTVKLFDSPEDQ